MDLLKYHLHLLALTSILIIIFFKLLKKFFLNHHDVTTPPSPPSLPFLGHLHLLLNIKPPHHQHLQALSAKYGPTLLFRVGTRYALLLSSAAAVERCFAQNDVVFSDRPETISLQITSYNGSAIGGSPYGHHWRHLRRVAATHIFSSTCIRRYTAVRNSQIRHMLQTLFRSSDPARKVRVNLSTVFTNLALRMSGMLAAGKPCDQIGDIFTPAALFSLCDFVPVLRWFGYRGIEKKVREMQRKRDEFLQGLIDEFRQEKSGVSPESNLGSGKTVLEAMMGLQAAEPQVYTDVIVKGMISAIFTAGMDTSIRTLEWAMALLLNHPMILSKARDELDRNLSPGQLIDDLDVPKLPYLRCIINEALRLFPVAPLLVPRCSSAECQVDGYKVPAKTILIVNAWAVHRDGAVWDEPDEFRPERFEGFDGERDGYRFIPFGVGRRSCPGAALGMRFIGLALATLIQCFDWERVGGDAEDLSQGIGGITLPKDKALEAMYAPRSSMTSIFPF